MQEQTADVATVLELIDLFWNNSDFAISHDLLTSDFLRHMPDGEIINGRRAMIEHVMAYRRQYPDMHITFNEHIFADNKLVLLWRFQGTDLGIPPTGQPLPSARKVDLPGVDVLHLRDGKLAINYVYYDLLSVMLQLDAVPLAIG